VKENGYLGIVSGLKFERRKGEGEGEGEATCYRLLICSKSTCEGPFAQELRRLVFKHLEGKGRKEEEMAKELFEKNVSLVFEVISPQFDTHIIQYSKETLFLLGKHPFFLSSHSHSPAPSSLSSHALFSLTHTLSLSLLNSDVLDVIENRLTTFRRFCQEKREALATRYGFEPKKFFKKIESWEEYSEWFKDIQEGKGCKLEDGSEIEGFVVEDSREGRGRAGEGEGEEPFMFKIKLSFYRLWKYARSHKDSIAR
jgi:tRNA splicing ligase